MGNKTITALLSISLYLPFFSIYIDFFFVLALVRRTPDFLVNDHYGDPAPFCVIHSPAPFPLLPLCLFETKKLQLLLSAFFLIFVLKIY